MIVIGDRIIDPDLKNGRIGIGVGVGVGDRGKARNSHLFFPARSFIFSHHLITFHPSVMTFELALFQQQNLHRNGTEFLIYSVESCWTTLITVLPLARR